MKKFNFHLEKLLSYKDQVLDGEMTALAELNEELRQAQKTLTAFREELAGSSKKLAKKVVNQATAVDFQLHAGYKEYLKLQINHWEIRSAKITQRIEEQIETIKRLKIETKSLETIKSSRYEDYKKEEIKASELQMEEFVSTARLMVQGI